MNPITFLNSCCTFFFTLFFSFWQFFSPFCTNQNGSPIASSDEHKDKKGNGMKPLLQISPNISLCTYLQLMEMEWNPPPSGMKIINPILPKFSISTPLDWLYPNWQSKILESSNFPSKACGYNHHTPCRHVLAHAIGEIYTDSRGSVPCSYNKFFLWPCRGNPIEEVIVCRARNCSMKRAVGASWRRLRAISTKVFFHWSGRMVDRHDIIQNVIIHGLFSSEPVGHFHNIAHAGPRNRRGDIFTMKVFIWLCYSDTFAPVRSAISFIFPYIYMGILTCWDYIFTICCERGRNLAIWVTKSCTIPTSLSPHTSCQP